MAARLDQRARRKVRGMSEMVERAAAALFAMDVVQWRRHSPEFRATAEKDVRRMIEAMREPTDAMVHAGTHDEVGLSESIWRSMIDEALK